MTSKEFRILVWSAGIVTIFALPYLYYIFFGAFQLSVGQWVGLGTSSLGAALATVTAMQWATRKKGRALALCDFAIATSLILLGYWQSRPDAVTAGREQIAGWVFMLLLVVPLIARARIESGTQHEPSIEVAENGRE